MILLYVSLGGMIGSLARFALGGWVTTWAGVGFPWGTFAVNVLGSVVIGALHRGLPDPSLSAGRRAFLMVGVCGGFTTFSTFDFETLVLLQQGRLLLAASYSLGSVAACILGVAAGMAAAARLKPAGA